MKRLNDWLKRCVTRRVLIVSELGMMAAIAIGVLAVLR